MSKFAGLWSVLQFKPNAYKLAEHNLNQQKFKTFLPSESVNDHIQRLLRIYKNFTL